MENIGILFWVKIGLFAVEKNRDFERYSIMMTLTISNNGQYWYIMLGLELDY
jgi:hypothetical protein